jgi:aldehyde:ferredoxin oxidoreductase
VARLEEVELTEGLRGRIAHVDLSRCVIEIETPSESFFRKYLGGSAMGMYYILKGTKPGIDPLGPENVLTLFVSLLTGAPISGQSRMCANSLSPLVDGIGDAQCGGFFPAEMRFSGFVGVVVTGKASSPVYLWLHDGQAELRPAGHLWGKTTSQVDDALKAEFGDDKIEIAQCGPAGEKLVRLAAIINMGNRANGRTGLGAVMGSKNLKAVVVRGTSKKLEWADGRRINEMARAGAGEVENSADMLGLQEYGTAGVVAAQHFTGTLPTHNYNAGQFEYYEQLQGESMADTILKANDTCYSCAVRCKRVVEAEWAGRRVERRYGGPEYETIATFGSYCDVKELEAVALANQLCNDYGLDTIGTGATVAWTMECHEKGLLTEQEIGFPAPFGDASAMIRLTEAIATRSGIGDILANGSRRAAQLMGKGRDLLITVKGAEAPAHMPQAKRSLALIYAVNPFGADHQSSEHDPAIEDGASGLYMKRLKLMGFDHTLAPRSLDAQKVRFVLESQKFYSFLDTAALCQFVWGPAWTLFGPQETVDFVRAATGWDDFTLDELLEIGERRLNMLRICNARLGIGRQADRLPEKFYRPLTGGGPTDGVALRPDEVEKAVQEYYALAGWDQDTGIPRLETLQRLGLEWVA